MEGFRFGAGRVDIAQLDPCPRASEVGGPTLLNLSEGTCAEMTAKPESPRTLDYAQADVSGRLYLHRAVNLFLAISLPPILCIGWALIGTQWLTRQPWWQSGQPHEGIYAPRFIDAPIVVCSIWYLGVVWIVGAMVYFRRWPPSLLAGTVCGAIIVWLIFFSFMFSISEHVFP